MLPFANETKKMKNDFKKMIDEMDDDAVLDMLFFLMNSDLDYDILNLNCKGGSIINE